MKFTAALFLNVLLAFVAMLWLPWWCIAGTAFLVGLLIPQRRIKSFLTAFLGLFLLVSVWCYVLTMHDDLRYAERISALIIKASNGWLIILISGLIPGLVAGVSALAGSFLRKPTLTNK